MAVIVKDMQMPANCGGCIFGRPLSNNECYCALHPTEKPTDYADSRPKYCPLTDSFAVADELTQTMIKEADKVAKSIEDNLKDKPYAEYINTSIRYGFIAALKAVGDFFEKEQNK